MNIVPWLIEHSAAVIRRYQLGEYGKTAHSRIRGRQFRKEVPEFGEKIEYLLLDSAWKDKF